MNLPSHEHKVVTDFALAGILARTREWLLPMLEKGALGVPGSFDSKKDGAASSPLKTDDVPKPTLPLNVVICHKCRVSLTQQELDRLSIGTMGGGSLGTGIGMSRKWRRYHANCTHNRDTSVSEGDFAIMLLPLRVFERYCVLISVANFSAAKKAIKLRLSAEKLALEGPLDDESEEGL